jgi:exosortase
VRQLLRWWLPALLVVLSVPLPVVVMGSLALPLQLKASEWGAALLELRHVPVLLAGNVIQLPGRSLFVTEACSGLRSLTSLVALGLLVGGVWLRTPWSRLLLVLLAVPVAMVLNAVRIFLTGFFVFYVDPRLAEGFMHYTEGWVIFVVAFAILGAGAAGLAALERRLRRVPA